MDRYLKRFADYVYPLLRFVTGVLFACHGAQKILGLLGGMHGSTAQLFSLIWFAGIIELIGGTLIAIGFETGWAAFICSGQMAFAYFKAHGPQGFWPVKNGGELAVLYCFLFLFIATQGDGLLSVGSLRRSR